MKSSDFDYHLPSELIAQRPCPRREDARLLVYHRKDDCIEHRRVKDLPEILSPDALMVFNDTKVIPARLYGRKPTGGAAEFLLLDKLPADEVRYQAIGKARRGFKAGEFVNFGDRLRAVVESKDADGLMTLRFEADGDIEKEIENAGVMPLPPYIRRNRDDPARLRELDKDRYQTVYAQKEGAVAAPTAGLHFSDNLIKRIENKGVRRALVTLHVGMGTFYPVREEDLEKHVMHKERIKVSSEAAGVVNAAKRDKRLLLAVGTTVCRTLESAWSEGRVVPGLSETRLFIKPGYKFQVVDALMTNFHLPRSTLLMLVSALIGKDKTFAIYEEAVRQKYRFYSYGDAMLLL
jgi:S-adenosylmethionine:tRNA ribosyltransferase-isomerase